MLALFTAGLAGALLPTEALATTAVGNQNPQLRVTSSLHSQGQFPNRATTGDTVVASGAVRNVTNQRRTVTVTITVRDPAGNTYPYSEQIVVGAGRSVGRRYEYVVDESTPRGVWRLTVAATNQAGTSSATSMITVY